MATRSYHSAKSKQSAKRSRKKQQYHPLPINFYEDSFTLADLLPHEIVLDILLRLPVKSLIRFKPVCKSWHSLISDPQFAKEHLSRLTGGDTIDPWKIIVRYTHRNLKSCSLHSVFHEPYCNAVELDHPLKNRTGHVEIVGSCDGLVCIYLHDARADIIYLWNPSTRESRKLPPLRKNYGCYGFGYDSSIDDYKLVSLNCINGTVQAMVYSLRTDSWKQIGNFPQGISSTKSGIHVNGSLNWVIFNCQDHSWAIVALDLAEETYREIPQPNYGMGRYELSVWALRGCLCAVCDCRFECSDVWIMNEYGVKESWTKLVSILYLPFQPFVMCLTPLWYVKDGGILVNFSLQLRLNSSSEVLTLYDLKERKFKHPLVYGLHDFNKVDTYLETLISPNALARLQVDLNK